jgi:hypothetical protein
VSRETGVNQCKEVLTFEVASFIIGYNYILGRPFLLKFLMVIHTAYATLKMPDPKGMITIKGDQRDALACENTTLMHGGPFNEKATQDQAAKVAKKHGGSTSFKSLAPKPPTIASPPPHRPPSAKRGAYGALESNQHPANQPTNGKKEADDKEVVVDLSNPDKKFWISTGLNAKSVILVRPVLNPG